MYKLSSASSGSYKLEVVSLGLYSLDGSTKDVIACQSTNWGEDCSSI